MPPQYDPEFPCIKAIARINSLEKAHEQTQFFDCKFYPYTPPGVDPIFAVVGKGETIVGRPLEGTNSGVGIIRWFREEDPDASLNSCTWSQDLESGDPLLCVSGAIPSIKILNVKRGTLVRVMARYIQSLKACRNAKEDMSNDPAKEVNDLAISPLSPNILASASMDHSVRFWSLDPAHKKQPCMLICAGEGHKEGLLTLAFHPTGRYLLTGGMDCVINLWAIPQLPDEATGTDKPTIIHYPHFSTNAIHTNFVDCVAWYNDYILSKCAGESKIVLWRIEGFNSCDTPPSPTSAPTTHEFHPTRSAFGATYQRLLQFEAAETTPFYMRFSLFTQAHRRPILVIGNEKSKVFFWDLQTLEEWDPKHHQYHQQDGDEKFKLPRARSNKKGVARKIGGKQRESSITSTTTTSTNSGFFAAGAGAASSSQPPDSLALITDSASDSNSSSRAKLKYGVEDPFRTLLPHKTHVVPRVTFAARQAAWSVGGEWMVVVGDQGMMALFAR